MTSLLFINKASDNGGAVSCYFTSGDEGALYFSSVSSIIFNCTLSVSFDNNLANLANDNGGVVHCWLPSHIAFEGNSSVTFNDNKTTGTGGAVNCDQIFEITHMVVPETSRILN